MDLDLRIQITDLWIRIRILLFKGIFQPFELGGMTRLIPSAVKFCEAGHLKKNFLMIQSHERSLNKLVRLNDF
jgi:hypothetical protein